jgi:hypothetical protein
MASIADAYLQPWIYPSLVVLWKKLARLHNRRQQLNAHAPF